MIVLRVFEQHLLLVGDTVALTVQVIVLRKSAIECCNLVLICHNSLTFRQVTAVRTYIIAYSYKFVNVVKREIFSANRWRRLG